MTILDVFRYDPLFKWCVRFSSDLRLITIIREAAALKTRRGMKLDTSPDNSMQDMGNIDVYRTLLQVKNKLNDQRSSECVVNELINEATDIRNLARMYVGWYVFYLE